jgi:hypothetical protein
MSPALHFGYQANTNQNQILCGNVFSIQGRSRSSFPFPSEQKNSTNQAWGVGLLGGLVTGRAMTKPPAWTLLFEFTLGLPTPWNFS